MFFIFKTVASSKHAIMYHFLLDILATCFNDIDPLRKVSLNLGTGLKLQHHSTDPPPFFLRLLPLILEKNDALKGV